MKELTKNLLYLGLGIFLSLFGLGLILG